VRIRPGGFELEFTHEIDAAAALAPHSYRVWSHTYEYHPDYGCPEIDKREEPVTAVEPVDDHTVRIRLGELRSGGEGYVYSISMPGVRSAAVDGAPSRPLLHDAAYYTVQKTVSGDR